MNWYRLSASSRQQTLPGDDFLHEAYPASAQWDFGMDVLRDIGYDFRRGRQDVSAHPFSTSFSIKDVRITTRLNERYLPSALFGSLHEAGHALYEQGIDPALEGHAAGIRYIAGHATNRSHGYGRTR